jgi:hypothetical protein
MNKIDLEKLINKPRAFRHHRLGDSIPDRQTMIILGSENFSHIEINKSYKIFKRLHWRGKLLF